MCVGEASINKLGFFKILMFGKYYIQIFEVVYGHMITTSLSAIKSFSLK